MRKFHVIACQVLWREFCYFASLSPHEFTFNFLEQGLHNTPGLLLKTLQKACDEARPCDAVLVGYGLCSRGVEGLQAKTNKLVLVRAHDCVTFFLGSCERYREYFDQHPGTYWYSPGWIETGTQPGKERQENKYQEYVEKYGEENAKYLMETEQAWFKNYNNAAYVDLGFGDTSSHREYTKKCAGELGWKCDFLQGDPKLLRDMVEGRWDEKRFLVVEPGYKVVSTTDESIVKSVKA